MRARIAVPATVANLGPGFDILALALQLQDEVEVDQGGESLRIDPGPGAPAELHDPGANLVTRAYAEVARRLGREPAPAHFQCRRRIPVGRGLGSSAAAALSGVLAAVALMQAPWDEQEVIAAAAELEGHRDNVAAALLGGLAVCAPGAAAVSVPVPDDVRAVVLVPDAALPTRESRAVVPGTVSREDAVFNAARCALWVRAVTAPDLPSLRVAMDDRWHQPARSRLVPWLTATIGAALDAGAHGAALAGAGPAVVALTTADPSAVAAAMLAAAAPLGGDGEVLTLAVRNFGARVDLRP